MEPTIVEAESGFNGFGVIYGPPKIGKSTLVSSLVDVSIDTENGMKMIDGALRYTVNGISEFNAAVIDAEKRGYKSISVDTVDYLNKWIEDIVCKELKINCMGAGKFGSSWQLAQSKMEDTIRWLRGKFDLVLFVGHQKQAIVEDSSVKSRLLYLPGQMSRRVCSEADFIGFCCIRDGKHVIDFKPYDGVDSGTRLPELKELVLEFSDDRALNQLTFEKLFEEKECENA